MDLGFDQVLLSTGLAQMSAGQGVMALVCLVLLWLAIAREFEPLLLVPIGFGGLLANVPGAGIAEADGFLGILYGLGVSN
ncbi:MAG: sodium ion-translocating decarboxylase subunit beta, partial [Myxococcota bacterium]